MSKMPKRHGGVTRSNFPGLKKATASILMDSSVSEGQQHEEDIVWPVVLGVMSAGGALATTHLAWPHSSVEMSSVFCAEICYLTQNFVSSKQHKSTVVDDKKTKNFNKQNAKSKPLLLHLRRRVLKDHRDHCTKLMLLLTMANNTPVKVVVDNKISLTQHLLQKSKEWVCVLSRGNALKTYM